MTADRDSNRTSSVAWKSLLLLTFASVGLMAQLPPEIEADRYMLRAESAITEQDYGRARGAMEKVLELQSEHALEIPVEFYFKYANVLQHSHAPRAALEMILRYLEKAGREGESYMAALKLMERVERAIAEVEASERAEQAEQERAAKVGAVRERAARELPAAIKSMAFVRIPAGNFRMGSKGSRYYPATRVRITRAFEIGKYEVTQSEWSAVMGQNPSRHICGRCPVSRVSWNDVQEFIGILNQAAGQDRPYRLPTEAEWEYAARSGATGERHAFDLNEIAWYGNNSGYRTHPVGEKMPNAFGLYDMLGNVEEWVQDWSSDYPGGRVTDPVGPSTGSQRVVRGGGYYSSTSSYWGTHWRGNRSDFVPTVRGVLFGHPRFNCVDNCDGLGFRLARTVK